MHISKLLVTKAALATATLMTFSAPAQAEECIAPSNPGGGWDFTCRTIGRILTELDLVKGNVQVTNMPKVSAMQAIVLAVPMTAHVPAVVAKRPST